MTDYRHIIDKYYPRGSALGVIYNSHCQAVADLACRIISARSLNIPPDEARAAAMLHDIGIYLCHAPSIECHGQAPYICHGTLGADLLRSEGAPEEYARVAERHTGSGLTPNPLDIKSPFVTVLLYPSYSFFDAYIEYPFVQF